MNGQWIGQYSKSSHDNSQYHSGQIMVNLDDMGHHYKGVAFLIDTNPELPITVAFLKTQNKDPRFSIVSGPLFTINPETNLVDHWEAVQKFFPKAVLSKEAKIEGEWKPGKLKISWSTDIGSGSAELDASKAGQPTQCEILSYDWEGYKKHVSSLEPRKYIFRGQECPDRLRTKFHRSGRADLGRFLNEDIQTLHKNLSARTSHIFNLSNPDENGAFFSLVQHHGYPTPLLDWTYSPYVAAFFAYRRITKSEGKEATSTKKVRIFIFDQESWRNDLPQTMILNVAFPYFSIAEFIAICNERMIPQQATSSVTNVDDIETYIQSKELQNKKKYLLAVDLPFKERSKVMRELSIMGITAGSLFPGLDGTCEEIKERFFDI